MQTNNLVQSGTKRHENVNHFMQIKIADANLPTMIISCFDVYKKYAVHHSRFFTLVCVVVTKSMFFFIQI